MSELNCPQCGKTFNGIYYCPWCGWTVPGEPAAPAAPAAPEQPEDALRESDDEETAPPAPAAAFTLAGTMDRLVQTEAKLARAARVLEKLRQGLTQIRDGNEFCQCDHRSEECCAKIGVYCPFCIAEAALEEKGSE